MPLRIGYGGEVQSQGSNMNLLKKISMGIGGSFLLSTGSLAQIPIEHLAQNPAFTSMSMSDDGTYIAGLVKIEGDEDLSLAVWDTDNLSKTAGCHASQ